MLANKTIAFLGAGSMAEAMIAGIVNTGIVPANQIIASNRKNQDRLKQLQKKYDIKTAPLASLDIRDIDIIILAMKPKDAETSLSSIKDSISPDQLILSVLAGVSTSYMEHHLPSGQQVVRVMPNTSSMIGESATAISPGEHTSKQNLTLAKELLECIGEVYVIPEEKMDIFTGIAGSGPAYFYYLMEHIEKEGLKAGLDIETTRQIMAQTIVGAGKMVQEKGLTPTVLRENVTSPNGTTAAGLEALSRFGGGKAISQAVRHASNRSQEMSSQIEEQVYENRKKKVI